MHNIVSHWAPPEERGKFISTLLGGTFGTVITWPLAGILVESCGWSWAFYVPALITFIVTILWYALVYDTPAEHPRIELTEREYIEKSLGDNISKRKVNNNVCCSYVYFFHSFNSFLNKKVTDSLKSIFKLINNNNNCIFYLKFRQCHHS